MSTLKEVFQAWRKNLLLDAHPVGSLYWSSNATDPTSLFGGSWERIKDKFILAAGDSYSQGSTGGSATHNHKYGISFGCFYGTTSWETDSLAGVLEGGDGDCVGSASYKSATGYVNANAAQKAGVTYTMNHHKSIANTGGV